MDALEIDDGEIARIRDTFLYAALLHDVGHAPFSHTCENFFKVKSADDSVLGASEIENELYRAIDSIPGKTKDALGRFVTEYQGISPSAHEIASAVLLVRYAGGFGFCNCTIDLELAARMVIGCTFEYKGNDTNRDILGIKNCFIRLLNSNAVDIDKLDYITRDARMSGFSNTPIDIDRLTRSVTAIKDAAGYIYPAFHKNVLSVIDNVFKAKSDESLWMVTHPVVVYEAALLKACIQSFGSEYVEAVFSVAALSIEGSMFRETAYRLLSDIDILTDLKRNYSAVALIHEFFDRKSRRHPIWKSFHEYRHLFGDHADPEAKAETEIFNFFNPLISYTNTLSEFKIDQQLLEGIDKSSAAYDAAELLKCFADQSDLAFDFVLLVSSSSFSARIEADQIYIKFSSLPESSTNRSDYSTYEFLKGKPTSLGTNNFFYMYTKERLELHQIEMLRAMIYDKVRTKQPRRV